MFMPTCSHPHCSGQFQSKFFLSTIIREPCQQHQCCFLQFLRFLLMQDNTITLGCNESMKDLIWCINIVA
ncbi:hypothetical protein I3760_13G134000 [Carya illinoinensis]|nr:hypothetical protein I3760_13G134000 [Carya illinoinensis]